MNLEQLLCSENKFHYDAEGQPISWAIGTNILSYIHELLHPEAHTLETGAGLSTVFFVLAGCHHIAISPDAREFEKIRQFCIEHEIPVDDLQTLADRSEIALPKLKLPPLDLVLIDGRHAFPSPYIDWFYSAEALKVGGLMVIDDTHLLTGRVLQEFLEEDTHWNTVKIFDKTAIFRKMDNRVTAGEWDSQLYILKRMDNGVPAGEWDSQRHILELESYRERNDHLQRDKDMLERRLEQVEHEYDTLLRSRSWRITQPLRTVSFLVQRYPLRFYRIWREEGSARLWQRTRKRLARVFLQIASHWNIIKFFDKTAIFRNKDQQVTKGESDDRPYILKRQDDDSSIDQLSITNLKSLSDFRNFIEKQAHLLARRSKIEEKLLTSGLDFEVGGFCYVCMSQSSFVVTPAYSYEHEGRLLPNWREQLSCRSCGLNNRMRASLHIFEHILKPVADSSILATEQVTPLFQHLKKRCPRLIGSEFLGTAVAQGAENRDGIRNENVTDLSFQDEEFDYVMSFDVLEYVPDFTKALSEFSRVLRPSGKAFFSVPFSCWDHENLIRAVQNEDGTIQHLLEPEYYGDPLNNEGCLAYHTFGWELLNQVQAAGFSNVTTLLYWSRDFAYLGPNQIFFIAEKE